MKFKNLTKVAVSVLAVLTLSTNIVYAKTEQPTAMQATNDIIETTFMFGNTRPYIYFSDSYTYKDGIFYLDNPTRLDVIGDWRLLANYIQGMIHQQYVVISNNADYYTNGELLYCNYSSFTTLETPAGGADDGGVYGVTAKLEVTRFSPPSYTVNFYKQLQGTSQCK